MADLKTNGEWDLDKLKAAQLNLRSEQQKDPIGIYVRLFQKKHKTHPRFEKRGNFLSNHGEQSQIVTYTSLNSKVYTGEGDSFTKARRNLCIELLKNKIDI